MTDIEMLPLPEYLYGREASDNERVVTVADAHAYAFRNVAHATAAKDAEIEALRAEVAAHFAQACKNGQKAIQAQSRAERLAEALREIESRPWNGVRPIQIAARAALRDHDQEGKDG